MSDLQNGDAMVEEALRDAFQAAEVGAWHGQRVAKDGRDSVATRRTSDASDGVEKLWAITCRF